MGILSAANQAVNTKRALGRGAQGCNKLLMTAPVGFGTPGKDAFHRVPVFVGEIGDAVERILTSQNRELDAALGWGNGP